jgi:hypothetical protein
MPGELVRAPDLKGETEPLAVQQVSQVADPIVEHWKARSEPLDDPVLAPELTFVDRVLYQYAEIRRRPIFRDFMSRDPPSKMEPTG